MLRRTPLNRATPAAKAWAEKRAPLPRKTKIMRVAMKRRAARARTVAQGGDPARLQWVRTLDCCACGRPGPSHAHHRTLSGRGKGQKSADDQTMPLCASCHSDLHSLTGKFRFFTRAQLDRWQQTQVAIHSGWYARLFGPAAEVA